MSQMGAFRKYEEDTVGTESIQTPLNVSLFVSLQKKIISLMSTQHPILTEKTEM